MKHDTAPVNPPDVSNVPDAVPMDAHIDALLAIVDDQGLTVEKLLVTHGHLDHVGVVAELAERLELPIEGPHR